MFKIDKLQNKTMCSKNKKKIFEQYKQTKNEDIEVIRHWLKNRKTQ